MQHHILEFLAWELEGAIERRKRGTHHLILINLLIHKMFGVSKFVNSEINYNYYDSTNRIKSIWIVDEKKEKLHRLGSLTIEWRSWNLFRLFISDEKPLAASGVLGLTREDSEDNTWIQTLFFPFF